MAKGKKANDSPNAVQPATSALAKMRSRFAGQSKLLLIGAAAVACSVVALIAIAMVVRSGESTPLPKRRPLQLSDAITALENGDYSLARRLAERLRQDSPVSQIGGPLYVLGACAAGEAEEFLDRERRDLYLLAANYLQDGCHYGFPEDHEGEGLFLLGKSLSLSGKFTESRAPLEAALTINPRRAQMLHWLLAAGYSKGENRDLPKALQHIANYLEDEGLESHDRYAGLLEKARMLYQVNNAAGCEAALSRIPREAAGYPDAELIRGRMAMRVAHELKLKLPEHPSPEQLAAVKQGYENATQILRRAQDDPLGSQTVRRSMYLIGVCYLEMHDYHAALAQFERTRKVWLDTQEGLAAALQEADLLRRASRQEEAMAAYLRGLSAAKAPFANAWIAPDQFRRRVLDAYRQCLVENQFEQAIALADRFSPLFPPARAADCGAEALRAWSVKLLAEADKLNEPQATAMRKKGRALMRKAGRLFAELARLEFSTRQYPDDLWRSAESYLDGHDFRSAVAAFEEYLKHETRKRRARALIDMGECYLALNRLEEALDVCQECVQFYPTDPACYQARLVISKVYVEKGDTAAAEALLRENLNGEYLAPESKEWRQSLFRLGELLQAGGRYDEAIGRLREAVERYPDAREAVYARYLIAESYRQLAKGVQDKLLKDTIETTRLAHVKELQTWLNFSVQFYKQVEEALNLRQEQTRLSPLEKTVLRNAYFAEGAAWFELGRYDSAIQAYSTVINRYQNDPEALEAFVQIASCYRRSNRQTEARGTIQQAKVVLNRMNPQAPFTDVTNNTRREWLDLLDWLSTL